MFWSKNKRKKDPWQIAAARFCVERSEHGFTKKELVDFIESMYAVSPVHIEFFFQEELMKPSGRQHGRSHAKGNWIPPFELVSKVIDYEELRTARSNAVQARWFSWIAILISLATLLMEFFD